MAPCCNNIVTPRMIKSGNVSIGDKIQLDEEVYETVSNSVPEAVSPANPESEDLNSTVSKEDYISAETASENSSEIMTPNGYDEEIDYSTIQALNGFLRTQIGRYMRIEQLVGSNTIQDRYGFLVGVGSNYIILQEITTGNIMVLDIFSVRLTYVYYSPPVLPNL